MLVRLVPLSGFEQSEGDHHRIRLLQVGVRCKVSEDIQEWARNSVGEYKRIIATRLKLIASYEELPVLKTIKRVGKKKQVVEVVGNQKRLFCFLDADGGYTVVCVNTFSIGSGNKKTEQSRTIEEADELRELWRNAKPVAGMLDTRVVVGRTGQ